MKRVFIFDLETNEPTLDEQVHPAEIIEEEIGWLYAKNNKYPEQSVDHNKVGKWMLFYPRDEINDVWKKVKDGIRNGNLWHAKVSTTNGTPQHAIMIYTRDYTDREDVGRVLSYLETSGLKPAKSVIKYKTDAQTRAGIYSGGKQRPWIYSSDTFHLQTAPQTLFHREKSDSQEKGRGKGETHQHDRQYKKYF